MEKTKTCGKSIAYSVPGVKMNCFSRRLEAASGVCGVSRAEAAEHLVCCADPEPRESRAAFLMLRLTFADLSTILNGVCKRASTETSVNHECLLITCCLPKNLRRDHFASLLSVKSVLLALRVCCVLYDSPHRYRLRSKRGCPTST